MPVTLPYPYPGFIDDYYSGLSQWGVQRNTGLPLVDWWLAGQRSPQSTGYAMLGDWLRQAVSGQAPDRSQANARAWPGVSAGATAGWPGVRASGELQPGPGYGLSSQDR